MIFDILAVTPITTGKPETDAKTKTTTPEGYITKINNSEYHKYFKL